MEQNTKLLDIHACPLCAGDNFIHFLNTKDFFFTQEDFSLYKCADCNFVFTNPVPTSISKYYETPDYLSHNTNGKGALAWLYYLLREINIKRKYQLVTKYCKQGNILDIGCGTGELLNFFKKNNWLALGVEPNLTAREFAANKYLIDVFEENKLDEFDHGTLDVISMWHVLEHVPDLHRRLSKVSKLLKDDGTIFIAVPNIDSPDSKKYKKYWSALDVPRHLYHFTPATFEHLISKHQLKLVHAEPMKFDSYYVSMLSEKYLKNRLYFLSASYYGYLSNLKAKRNNNYSSMIFVVKKD
ncbi:MAG: class I SAM-dependent methyltransferase [Bacteroidetes bacterium]|nr:class I SAM-dependent methyltransferase [Bacteroidota bacterium]MBL6942881.1 class I SAM-dependent methyltransferase [Bacteroidales bacterium]